MKRITILLIAVLALVVSACGSGEPSESAAASEPAATVEPTPEPTPEPTTEPEESEEPAESADAGGDDDTALLDLLPDEINGQSRIDVDLANNPMFAAALAQQDIDASDVEYVVSTYGSGEGILVATAIRIPGMGQVELEQLGRLMSGMSEGQGSAELTTVGGKEVLAITATEAEQTGYMYFIDGAVIVIGGTSEDLAEEFFTQLP